MFSRLAGICPNAGGFTQCRDTVHSGCGFVQLRQCLVAVVESAISEAADLEQVVHYADEVGLTVSLVGWHTSVGTLRILGVVGAAVGESERVAQFMHQRAGLRLERAYVIVTVHFGAG